ncbi:response regulator transcription factor [Erysipelotrichaceae bacterium Oil+RF-744-GAM-WT-6]|jgi:two-component system response regulator ResD|uniref:Response regulator transcription factor n=1 Tax=Stecheria intestinalis TaxID=2606630 RepID=A0A7X2NRB3_9FIRM|nr:response regulator transcription factor [Stecheria intestinalis]MDY4681221.1 response regulator transcription factor [Lachnospiraceae bacterium]MDD5881857.1 response regulator transcription factor [Stecheria intestinalis]MDD6366043.1 response regulator transcription factor [Stecheria intestinalis]MDD7679729.1 response regulator transcription factor [Stecheria intestinalis]MSS58074.1 response regulator transcription factor [Stecheria intestinalis]
MTRILIVDDEEKIRQMIRKYAEYEGFETDEAEDGLQAVEKCSINHYDLVVMDIMMPNLDGFSACKEIKKTQPDLPFIMLSALGEEYDKVHGFDLGVDDYVVKPFSSKELMMRIHAILKRVHPASGSQETFHLKDLAIDYNARVVTIKGERLNLSPKEYELLVYLVKNAGIALTREQILQTVWGYDFYGDDRTLDTHIKLLRKNLGEYSRYLVTLRGVGYRFEKENQSEVENS